MRLLLRVLRWLLNAALFFTLFAFALNNQHVVGVHFFFGHKTQQPMALIVLVSFAIGLFVGVLGMLSTLWRGSRKPVIQPGATDTAPAPLDSHSGPAPRDNHTSHAL